MPSTPREVLTGVRILACVARADGRLTDDERAALEGAISALPGEIPTLSVSELLASDIDLDLEIAQLLSDESRQQVYEAAMVLATADGEASPQELAMLERLSPLTAEPTMLGQIIGETADTFLPTHISTIHDPEQRTAEVQEDTLKYAILCAGLGAMPIPGASLVTDLLVVARSGDQHGGQHWAPDRHQQPRQAGARLGQRPWSSDVFWEHRGDWACGGRVVFERRRALARRASEELHGGCGGRQSYIFSAAVADRCRDRAQRSGVGEAERAARWEADHTGGLPARRGRAALSQSGGRTDDGA